MTVNDDNLKDVIRELELEDMPSSAVELTNKEKVIGMKSGTEFIYHFIYFIGISILLSSRGEATSISITSIDSTSFTTLPLLFLPLGGRGTLN
jgi:hypothetical protein